MLTKITLASKANLNSNIVFTRFVKPSRKDMELRNGYSLGEKLDNDLTLTSRKLNDDLTPTAKTLPMIQP